MEVRRFRRRVESWEDWKDMLKWRRPSGGEEREEGEEREAVSFSAESLRLQSRNQKRKEPWSIASSTLSLDEELEKPLESSEKLEKEEYEEFDDCAQFDMETAYLALEDAVIQLWTSPDSPETMQPERFGPDGELVVDIPSPLALQKLCETIVRENERVHRLYCETRFPQATVKSVEDHVFGQWIVDLQRNPRLFVSLLASSAQLGERAFHSIVETAVYCVLNPMSISESALVEFLAHVLHACELGVISKRGLWTVLLTLACRVDLQSPLYPFGAFLSLDSLIVALKTVIPPPLIRICQLLTASRSGISTSRVVFEGWLVPFFLFRAGNKRMASRLSEVGFALDHPSNANDRVSAHVLFNAQQLVDSILHAQVDSTSEFPSQELCNLVVASAHDIRNLVALAQFCEGVRSVQLDLLENRVQTNAHLVSELQETLCHVVGPEEVALVWCGEVDDWVEKVGWRVSSLKNLVGRLEEVLAREALVKQSVVALQTRHLEVQALVQEAKFFKHEAFLSAAYESQLLRLLAFLAEWKQLFDTLKSPKQVQGLEEGEEDEDEESDDEANNGGNINFNGEFSDPPETSQAARLRRCIRSIQKPVEFLEQVYFPVSGEGETKSYRVSKGSAVLYHLSDDQSCLIREREHGTGFLDSEDIDGTITLNDIVEARLGLAKRCSHTDGIRWSSSLGCCFYLLLENDVLFQLVARTEDEALYWVFTCQHLSSKTKEKWSLAEFRHRQSQFTRERRRASVGHVQKQK